MLERWKVWQGADWMVLLILEKERKRKKSWT